MLLLSTHPITTFTTTQHTLLTHTLPPPWTATPRSRWSIHWFTDWRTDWLTDWLKHKRKFIIKTWFHTDVLVFSVTRSFVALLSYILFCKCFKILATTTICIVNIIKRTKTIKNVRNQISWCISCRIYLLKAVFFCCLGSLLWSYLRPWLTQRRHSL